MSAGLVREEPPTLRDVSAVLFRQKRAFLAMFMVTLLLALLWSFSRPRYAGTMKFLVQRARLDPVMTAASSTQPLILHMEVTEEELNSEAELLRDEDLLRELARDAGLVGNEGPHWFELPGGDLDRAATQLSGRLTVEPVRRTNLVSVTYRSQNPALTEKVLKTLSRLYLEKHPALHRSAGESQFFTQQAEVYRTELVKAETSLMDFSRRTGNVSATQQRDLALQKLSSLEAGQQDTMLALAEAQQRVLSLGGEVQSTPLRETTQIRTADNPYLLQQLKTTLLNLELKRTELLTRYQPDYPLVQEVDQQIAQAEQAAVKAQQDPIRDAVTDKEPRHAWAQTELMKAQVELAALRSRASASTGAVSRYRALAQNFGEASLQQEDLLRAARLAEENYLVYQRRREESKMGDALDERGIVNVTLAQPPVVPVLPFRSGMAILFIAFVAAGTLSTGAAFTADHLDPAFRTPEEASRLLGAPVLASFPAGTILRNPGEEEFD